MAKLTSTDIYGSLLVQGNTEILGSLKVGNVDVALKTELPVNATASTYGLIKLGSDTVQSVAGNSVSSVAGKSYLIQKNSAGQLLVNVPWTDTQTVLPTFYNLVFKNNENSIVDTYKPTTSPTKTLLAGTNVSMTASNNIITISATDNDTKNTAGSNQNTGKLFIVGAKKQEDNSQTFSNNKVYIDGSKLYSNSSEVVNLTDTQTITGAKSFTGDSTAKTQAKGDNSTKIATTAFVKSQAYITGYTETDTLQTITTRGATTDKALVISNTTDATSSEGAIRTTGGVSMAKKLYVGTSATIGNTLTVKDISVTNSLSVKDLTVTGTLLTKDAQQVNIGDNIILLNAEETGTPSENAGIEVERGTSPNTSVVWNEGTDRWTFTNDGTNYHNIPVPTEYNNYTHPTYSGNDTSSSVSPGYAGTFTAIDSITSTNGHITAINLKTVTMPSEQTLPSYVEEFTEIGERLDTVEGDIDEIEANKVDKVTGKGLSTNDYTTDEKNKLAGIASGAEVNVQSDWNATSGDALILNKPTIPTKVSHLTNDTGYITEYAETDPIFTAWNKSTGISITKSQVSDLIEATQALSGLMSTTDKQRLDVLHALLEEDTANNVVDSINEVLAIFNNYPEGADLVTALAGKVDKVTGKGLSTNDLTNILKTNYDNAYTHSQSTHAPINAQKNSDITKAEIEAKLIGAITSHSHTLPSHNHDDRYYTESEIDNMIGDIDSALNAILGV